jgi:purine-nucleoside phosphorylase
LIRIGTCGTIQENIKVRDVVLAMSASTDSNINKLRFNGSDFAPTACFKLINKAYEKAREMGINVWAGNVLTSDTFYNDEADSWKIWARFGVLAVEMETAALYTLAAKFGVDALSILTVSDNIITGEITSSEEREKTFRQMIEIALELAE